jgi:predicted DNA-binding protein with PD1-like motif
MEKIKVKIVSRSGSTKRDAELCSHSGIIEYDDSYSHISAIAANGEKIEKNAVVVIPEPVKVEVVIASVKQSEPTKKKNRKG